MQAAPVPFGPFGRAREAPLGAAALCDDKIADDKIGPQQ